MKISDKTNSKIFYENKNIIDLPLELLTAIFLRVIERNTFAEAKRNYLNFQLVNKKFSKIKNNSYIIKEILKKSHRLPIDIIRNLPLNSLNYKLLKRSFENKLNDILILTEYKNKRMTCTIDFLNKLKPEERDLIQSVDLSLLEPPQTFRIFLPEGRVFFFEKQFSWQNEFIKFLSHLKKLKKVYLFEEIPHAEKIFSLLANCCPDLRKFEIQGKNPNTQIDQIIYFFPKIESIHFKNCSTLTDEMVLRIMTNCTKITALSIEGCPLITENIFFHLKHLRKELKKLSLKGSNFGDSDTEYLVANFPMLESLNISQTANTSLGIQYILQSSLPLKTLNFSHLNILDEDFDNISASLKDLRKLELYHCQELSSAGLQKILQIFPNLEYLDMRFCPKLSGNLKINTPAALKDFLT
ncbi:MAG: hypothetical protein Tsb0015_16060 [Simkaniaceae bacterium]